MGLGSSADDDDDEASLLTPLGEFMLRRNAELGLSVSAVAQRVGMSRATWYRMARGESTSPGMRLLRGLARVYQVRPAELFTLAAYSDPTLGPAPANRCSSHAPQPGDVLWRCRHEPQTRPGGWLTVELQLLNLSGAPWREAEIRPVHRDWLPLHPQTPPAGTRLRALGEAASCTATLHPTEPGEWTQARLMLRAPESPGDWLLCLALQRGPADPLGDEPAVEPAHRLGSAGAVIRLETR